MTTWPNDKVTFGCISISSQIPPRWAICLIDRKRCVAYVTREENFVG